MPIATQEILNAVYDQTNNLLRTSLSNGGTINGNVTIPNPNTLTLGTALTVANGGTGATTLTSNGVLYGNGAGAIQATSQGAANSILTANAGAPSFSASPTIGTSVTVPTLIGGTAVGSSLNLQSTSGVGTTDFIRFLVGNNGATEAIRITSGGNVGIGMTGPGNLFTVNQAADTTAATQGTYGIMLNDQTANRLSFGGDANYAYIQSWSSKPLQINNQGNNVILNPTAGNVGIGTTSPSRLLHVAGRYQLGGTAIATTDWALTSGWGANATISAVTGTDSRGTVTVTTSALDTPSANPVITLTFKDGTWTTTPFCAVSMQHASTGPSTVPATCQASATTLALSYRGTPTATSALTYIFNYMVVG